ncbi:MAG TPA: hypothetical protein VJ306_11290 [Pyrinomonadaceae bacterium]|jgi:hypothetical protein|nr:hypothetical protein [Pyrinomonadaceae bacterium]
MNSERLELNFNGMPVGYFEETEYPRKAGRYRYMPYRGPGHYQMQTETRESGRARCYYNIASERVFFDVLACAEYGFLELRNFKITPVLNNG